MCDLIRARLSQNEAVIKASKQQALGSSVDLVEAHLHALIAYNVLLNQYMLHRVSGCSDVNPKLQLSLVRLRVLLTRLGFIQSKLENRIENAFRTQSAEVR